MSSTQTLAKTEEETITMTKPNNIRPLDQWVALNRILKAYKIAGVLLGLLCMALVALVFYLATSPPVVVVLERELPAELLPRGKKKGPHHGARPAGLSQRVCSASLHLEGKGP